jgi:hypothetical protein
MIQPRRHIPLVVRRLREARDDGGWRVATAVWRSGMMRLLRTRGQDQSRCPVKNAISSVRPTGRDRNDEETARGLVPSSDSAHNARMSSAPTTEPFVVKRRGLGTTKTALFLGTLVFGLMVLLTLGIVLVQTIRGGSTREPLESVWLAWGGTPLIFAVGLPVLLVVGAITAVEESREADVDDVLLTVDDAGIYLGGEAPRTIPWAEIRGICRLERQEVNDEGEETWEPRLVILLLDEDALPRSSKAWGPSCPWPGTHEILGRTLPYDELVTAVARHAPHVRVTNRGRVTD